MKNYRNLVKLCLLIVFFTFFLSLNWTVTYNKECNCNDDTKTVHISYDIKNKNDLVNAVLLEKVKPLKEHANVRLFDLRSPLEPSILYDSITCRKSAFYVVETTLCIHPLEKDIWVSSSIWKNGAWEGNMYELKVI